MFIHITFSALTNEHLLFQSLEDYQPNRWSSLKCYHKFITLASHTTVCWISLYYRQYLTIKTSFPNTNSCLKVSWLLKLFKQSLKLHWLSHIHFAYLGSFCKLHLAYSWVFLWILKVCINWKQTLTVNTFLTRFSPFQTRFLLQHNCQNSVFLIFTTVSTFKLIHYEKILISFIIIANITSCNCYYR